LCPTCVQRLRGTAMVHRRRNYMPAVQRRVTPNGKIR